MTLYGKPLGNFYAFTILLLPYATSMAAGHYLNKLKHIFLINNPDPVLASFHIQDHLDNLVKLYKTWGINHIVI